MLASVSTQVINMCRSSCIIQVNLVATIFSLLWVFHEFVSGLLKRCIVVCFLDSCIHLFKSCTMFIFLVDMCPCCLTLIKFHIFIYICMYVYVYVYVYTDFIVYRFSMFYCFSIILHQDMCWSLIHIADPKWLRFYGFVVIVVVEALRHSRGYNVCVLL